MKAIVFHKVGDIRLDDVKEPAVKDKYDAIVRLTASAICGTDLHFVRGTVPNMIPGTILGHEGVGIVEEVGKGVRNLCKGDRVVIPSTIACGSCSYCRAGYFAQCDDSINGNDSGCFRRAAASSTDYRPNGELQMTRPFSFRISSRRVISQPTSPTFIPARPWPSLAAGPSGSSPSPVRNCWARAGYSQSTLSPHASTWRPRKARRP